MKAGTKYFVAGIVTLAVVASLAVVIAVPGLHWRAKLAVRKITGNLPDITWMQFISMARPGSGFWLAPAADDGNLYAAIRNPFRSERDIEQGESLFRSRCASCHGADHSAGPDLSRGEYRHGDSDWALFRTITRGVPGTPMIGWDLADSEVWSVIAYLRSSGGKSRALDDTTDARSVELSYQRIVDARNEPQSWLTYSGAYDGQRYSELDEINKDTVGRLRTRWIHQMVTSELHVESAPLVVDGVMFTTEPPDKELALDASTGELLWSRTRRLSAKLSVCCGLHNRGVAVMNGRVYRGTLDAHLIARDASNGALVWDIEVAEAAAGYSITAAPLAVKNMIVVGISGGEFGIRGFLDAYDADTGKRLWRFHTIPAAGEPGNETWSGESWKTGGGPTWMTGSFDPEVNLIYWGVGNPAPNYNGATRQGDNLYTNSVVALDADSGVLKWHFQFTPHDLHDWDANQVPVLVDQDFDGKPRKLLLTANKNGFGYVLDRVTGEFLRAYEIVEQTWASSIDDRGRPVLNDGIDPSQRGTYVRPSTAGATNWWPPSYSPVTRLLHVPTLERGSIYFQGGVKYSKGESFTGSAGQGGDEAHYTALRAFDPTTGVKQWEYRLAPRRDWTAIGGALTTAGGLVFFGDKGFLYALDADTGQELWHLNVGSAVRSPPITYRTEDGDQIIAITAGRSIFALALGR